MTSSRAARGMLIGVLAVAAAASVAAQAVLSRVGVSETDAKNTFLQSMVGIASPGAASRPFLALAPSARATVVTDVVTWAKAYANSAAFKKAWAEKRDEAKPEAPQSDADAQKQQASDQQKQLDDLKKTIASLPPDQQKAMQAMVDQLIAQQAAQQKDPAYQALVKQSADATKSRTQKDYQDAVATWQKDYPADPNVAIARRLRDFLAMSADVNFDATLVGKGTARTFADPKFEAKPDAWKLCYRAGREATAAARAAAQAWLKEIGQ
jgi:chemotaxis protein histidine kinase CheA